MIRLRRAGTRFLFDEEGIDANAGLNGV
jgi:hypothetical protein